MARLVLGSRGSALALAQVELVKVALSHFYPRLEIEVKIVTTSGDRRQDLRAGEGGAAGLKGLFTKEIQDALLDGSIDAAVHSLKDLPGLTPEALVLAAVLPRADTSDLLISPSHASLDTLPHGARIGTGSIRRSRQVQWLRPGIEIVELRGNVPTRLQRLGTLSLDGIILARAGLHRLGYSISEGLLESDAGLFHATPLDILPAIGQGAIGIEARLDDDRTGEFLASIDHPPSHACIRVERELLRLLEGDCHLPVAALATLDDSSFLNAEAILFPDDPSAPPAHASALGPASHPELIGLVLFDQFSPGAV